MDYLWFKSRYFARGKTLRYVVTFCSCTGFLLLGYDQGVMGSIIGDPVFLKQFGYPDATTQGLLTSVYDLGCVLGSIVAFFVGEKLGRRAMMLFGAFIMMVGTVLLGSSYTRAQWYVGRMVTGIGNGFNSSTIPVYQSECATGNNRGRLLTWQAIVTILGVVIAYWIGFGCSYTNSSLQWRFPISFQGIFAIALFFETWFLPESPRWLVQQGRSEEAAEVLAALDSDTSTITTERVIRQRIEIETAVEMESRGGPFKVSELFSGGELQNYRRLLISLFLMFAQQFGGSNFINYYAPTIFTSAMNMDRVTSLILAGCTEIVYLGGSFIPLWLIDNPKLGRRNLLMISGSGLSFCFIMVSILLSIGGYGCSVGATFFVFLYQLFTGVGWLPVPWFMAAEINITRLRSRVQAVASAFNWLCVFAVVQITPIAIDNIGWKTFIIFAILCAAWVPIVFVFIPETAGLELEDIDYIFKRTGFTRGVWETRGRTVQHDAHARAIHLLPEDDEKDISIVEVDDNGSVEAV
ncbi:hypothetical protein PSN45_001441 [Yamadazyma tenuis]|uniref:General substrate transporter n=1 Tax=Candida tenuis (strain ATCC 10573 / BCRC 21748 / CBS 615 / JCM 9827 / NBRC 10315 / NRRL Y-1498 / VKM Y-70) TaxID=590646 RepID=G3BC22_CANTC|nr:general substrate transporter [Yamadazyma tenuis ATCC 10573]EGV60763.1 general substrate transporter [Yamadazyma tenuis ATCC 10573]WEJ93964.1 hypothetical protein PSN45_001441 [Yamadazyma tenuis]